MSGRIVVLVMAAIALLPARGSAQALYVGAGGGVSLVRTDHSRQEVPISRDTDTGGSTGMWLLQGGGSVTHGVVWQAQWSSLLAFTSVIGPAVFETPCATCRNQEITIRRSADELAVLGGYRIGHSRAAVTPMVGIIIVREDVQRIEVSLPAGTLTDRSVSVAYTMTPAFGIDGEIPLPAARLVLAPQARIHFRRDPSFSGSVLETSLQLALRWTVK